jgi:ABC-type histidine transport system ATPase subunit
VDGIKVEGGEKGGRHRQLVHDIRLKTGMVFQEFNLFPHMTVLDNVIEGPVTVKKMDRSKAVELGEMNLERVGLSQKRDEYPNRLSGVKNSVAMHVPWPWNCGHVDEPICARSEPSQVLNVSESSQGHDYAGRNA